VFADKSSRFVSLPSSQKKQYFFFCAFSVKCEEICHGEFAGKNRRCGRRMGEKSSHCSHTPLQPPHAKENVFPAPAEQAVPYDHGPSRYVGMKILIPFQLL